MSAQCVTRYNICPRLMEGLFDIVGGGSTRNLSESEEALLLVNENTLSRRLILWNLDGF